MSSALTPYVDLPFPNLAAEEARLPHDPDAPVSGVSATTRATPVESEEARPPNDYVTSPDIYELSRAARERTGLARTESAEDYLERTAAAVDAARREDNLGIRELIRSFQDYDNAAARARYNNFLSTFARYGGGYVNVDEGNAVANLRAQEDERYMNLGISRAEADTRATREGMSGAIDRWFVGEGVFFPAMLQYNSSDGFMFTPVSSVALQALRSAEALATYERTRIAAYMREMAALTPEDFMFYDPTGLGALGLEQRREFLRRIDALLLQEQVDARAADLRYVFDERGRLVLEELGLDDENLTRIEQLRQEINSYYGQLLFSVHNYKAGIISEGLA